MSTKKSNRKKQRGSSLASAIKTLLTGALAAAGGWIVYSRTAIDHDLPLPPAIDAERKVFFSQRAGRISYYVDSSAQGRPLLLVHSVNAAASAYEMRPLFEAFRGKRPVYAIDLPGYGFSERSDREYSPEFFEQALIDMLEEQIGERADVIALSLGSEFAARAAVARPELFYTLAMISPTGLRSQQSGRGSQKTEELGLADATYAVFSAPLWARAFFDLIATRTSIHYFLQQSFVGQVDPGLEDYAYQTSHQPGAEYVPLYFLSGKLFTRDVLPRVYEKMIIPTMVIFDEDPFVGFERLDDLLRENPHVQAVRITPTRGLPQFENLEHTIQALEGFWERHL